ncbi:MAG: phage tail protein [Synergistaceae bacterium]|nr:phage tail protein [Synergistaceae bacterium]
MVGSFGDIVFEVYDGKFKTFRDLQIQRSAKYAEHSIHGRKGLLEFTGLSPASASLSIKLAAWLGVNPKEELQGLREILETHTPVPLIFDGEPQGDNLWVLESLDEKFEYIDNKGTFWAIDVALKLREYIEVNSEDDRA